MRGLALSANRILRNEGKDKPGHAGGHVQKSESVMADQNERQELGAEFRGFLKEYGPKHGVDDWFAQKVGLDERTLRRWKVVDSVAEERNWEAFITAIRELPGAKGQMFEDRVQRLTERLRALRHELSPVEPIAGGTAGDLGNGRVEGRARPVVATTKADMADLFAGLPVLQRDAAVCSPTTRAALFGLFYFFAVLEDMVYQFDKLDRVFIAIAMVAGLSTASLFGVTLVFERSRIRRDRPGLAASFALLCAGLGALYGVLVFGLAAVPLSSSQILASPEIGSLFKNILVYPTVLALFIVPSYYTVNCLRRAIDLKLWRATLSFLTNGSNGALVRPSGYIPVRALWFMYAGLLTFGIWMTLKLLNTLQPSHHSEALQFLIYARFVVFWGMAGWSVYAYDESLQHLKRICLKRSFALPD